MNSLNADRPKSNKSRTNSFDAAARLGSYFSWFNGRQTMSQLLLIALLTAVAVALSFPAPIKYKAGDVAESTIRADQALRLTDETATELLRRKAALQSPPVYILDDDLPAFLQERAADIFSQGRQLCAAGALQPEAENSPALAQLRDEFDSLFDSPRRRELWDAVTERCFSPTIERSVLTLAGLLLSQGLLEGDNPFISQPPRPVSVLMMSSQKEYLAPSGSSLLDLDSARRFLEARLRFLNSRYGAQDTALIADLTWSLIRPNLKLDSRETERRTAAAVASVEPIHINVRAGEVIVREGSIISAEAMEKLRALDSSASVLDWLLRFVGLFIVLFVFFNASFLLSQLGPRKSFQLPPLKEQIFVVLLLMMAAVMVHAAVLFGSSLAWDFDFIDGRTIFYALPLATMSMLTSIFFGPRKASFMALYVAVVTAAVTPPGARFLALVYCYNGSIAAVWCLRNMNERGQLIPASFWVMVVNCITLSGLTFFSDAQWSRQILYNFMAAAASGLLSGITASGLISLVELIFGFSTNLKLMELGNLDRPILRQLMLSAPGTYHHSVIVGAMVEAAAEAIGANTHLAKVGAYYHDIGKIKKPLYFVENQSGENRHDTLAPSMSALILIGHVRDGLEMAKAHKLPQAICDIIEQHHGTSQMAFFYHKAMQMRQEGQPEINDSDYRYPGPRPRSREAGLVMLADICEAATRSLSDPSPTKIQNMVRQLVNQIFSDGQLDESELKGREIADIISTFTTILVGIYHRRVSYPGLAPKSGQTQPATAPCADRGDKPKEIYGNLPVESAKNLTH